MREKYMRNIMVLCLLIAAAVQLSAQPKKDGRPMERVERFKKMRMVEILDMSEDQSVRFFARHNGFENTRRELTRQKDESLDKIERLLRNNADPKEYEKVFSEIEATNRKIGEEKLKFFNSLSDILTIEQRAKLMLFERRFESELRDAVRQVQQRSRRKTEEQQ